MILSSSGQNIFPEEIEARLNNMPFVLESLVIERNKRLVALVYADYEALDSLGLNQPDNLKTIMDENLKNLNNSVAAYEKVAKSNFIRLNLRKRPKEYQEILIQQHCRRLICVKHIDRDKNSRSSKKKYKKKLGVSRTTYSKSTYLCQRFNKAIDCIRFKSKENEKN